MRIRVWAGVLALAALSSITGCGNFFQNPNSTTTTTTSGSNSGDYFYVVNQSADTLSGWSIGTGVVTQVANSPYALTSGLVPDSVAVTRENTFVYVGAGTQIQGFSIGTGGALTAASAATSIMPGLIASIDASPVGDWLLVLSVNGSLGQLSVCSVNTSTGALAIVATLPVSGGGGVVTPQMVKFAPSGLFAAAALGTGGDALFSFNNSSGALVETTNVPTASTLLGTSDNAVQFDASSTYLFIGETRATTGTSLIATWTISNSLLTNQVTTVTGDAPAALQMDSKGAYLYCANRGGNGNVSGFSFSSGTLTPLAGSPFLVGPATAAMARDNSGDYLIILADGASTTATTYHAISVYGLDAVTGGQLDSFSEQGSLPASSTSVAVAVAATH